MIFQNWVQGLKYSVKDEAWKDMQGTYKLVLNTSTGPVNYTLDFKSNNAASIIGKDTVTSKFYYDGKPGKNQFCTRKKTRQITALAVMVK